MRIAKLAFDADADTAPYAKGSFPLWKLTLVALPQMTVRVFWTFLWPSSAPFLMRLGMSPSLATLNNMAGPITGFFTVPIVGAMSDSLTSAYGRRRPVIAAGMVLTWVAGILFASSEHIMPEGVAFLAAVPMYWVLDITINILQAPHRALVSDIASEEQQIPMQVIILCHQSLGFFIGFSLMRLYDVAAEHMLELVMLVCLLNTLAIVVQFSVAEEQQLQPDLDAGPDARCSVCAPVISAFEAAKESPPLVWRLAAVQGLVSVGGTAWAIYGGQWFGICVFEGDPFAPPTSIKRLAFVAGQTEVALAGQSKHVLMLVASLCILSALQRSQARPMLIYAACIFIGALTTFCAAFLVGHSRILALVSANFSILPFAGFFSIPYGLLAKLNKRAECEGRPANTALQMSLLNCAGTFGNCMCTALLAAIEGGMALAQALPLIFTVAAASELLSGVGTLLVDCSMEGDRTEMFEMGKREGDLGKVEPGEEEGDRFINPDSSFKFTTIGRPATDYADSDDPVTGNDNEPTPWEVD